MSPEHPTVHEPSDPPHRDGSEGSFTRSPAGGAGPREPSSERHTPGDPGEPEETGERAEPVVRAHDLLVGYDGTAVCTPASFALAPGEALFLVGINGAGKSTLLRTCCGLQPALDGGVEVLGLPPDPRSPRFRTAVARDLGEEAFFPALSVEEHLRLVCLGHAVPDADDVVATTLSEFGLESVADAVPDRLSSGQRRRLALASVFVRPRRLLVLDEPEQRLDHATRVALARRMVAERENGNALLIVSHDPLLLATAATGALLVGEDTRPLSTAEAVRAVEEGAR